MYRWPGECSARESSVLRAAGPPGLNVEYKLFFRVPLEGVLVNGYSGYFPPWFRPTDAYAARLFPRPRLRLSFLEALGVRLVIVHTDRLEQAAESVVSALVWLPTNRLRKIPELRV